MAQNVINNGHRAADEYNSVLKSNVDRANKDIRGVNNQLHAKQISQQQSSLQQQRDIANNRGKNIRNAADALSKTKIPYASTAGKAVKTADTLTGGKSSEMLEKKLAKRVPGGRALQKIAGGLSGDGKAKKGDETEISNDSKESINSGIVDAKTEIAIPKSILWKILLLGACCCIMVAFFVSLISSVFELRLSTLVLGKMTADDRQLLEDMQNEIGQGYGSELGMGSNIPSIYQERLEKLGNVYSSDFKCDGEECLERPEFRYYLKAADILYRYENKYNVNLDWVLLHATMMFSDSDEEKTMKRSLHDYNLDDVENLDLLMDLDWDYDYKKIPGYKYLNPDDFRYDLQILAKNMVTKTTTQTCTKTVTDDEGNTTTVVTKSQTDIDIEAQYFEPGEAYYLKCDAGETYNITNDYKYDADKYDEFLLEYIERKYYMPSLGIDPDTGDTDMTPSSASGEYIFPLPSGATSCRSSLYGPRIHPISGEQQFHSGDDYPAAAGTPVYAVASGTVAEAGYHNSMGNYVKINHGNGVQSVYMHASKLFVSTGDKVSKGDVIMAVGTTGSSTGNHLHITFYNNGSLDSPSNYIGALPAC